MQPPKIFVSNPTFARSDEEPLKILLAKGWEVKINGGSKHFSPDQLAREAAQAEAVVCGSEDYRSVVDRLPKLKFISRTGIGLDNIPLARCKSLGIRVHHTPDAVTEAVSEIVLGQMITLLRGAAESDREMREGRWKRLIGPGIRESAVGILGFGRVGKSLARLLAPFKPARVLVNDERDVTGEISLAAAETGLNLVSVPFRELLQNSDVLTLHVPKKKNTVNLISAGELSLMKKEACLINFSRGAVVNERDLHACLSKGGIRAAALDVFPREPYRGPLTELPNLLLTAHMGSCSAWCRLAMETQAARAVVDFFDGNPLKNEADYEEDR